MRKKTINFSKYSSIRLGPVMDVGVIENEADAKSFDGLIVGGAYNLIVTGKNQNLGILGEEFEYMRLEEDKLYVGAAMSGGRLFSFAKKNNLEGFEFIGGLPGTIGGMLSMNAGLKGQEIFNNLISIKFADGYRQKEEIEHGYRYARLDGIALEAVFDASKKGFDEGLYEELKNARKNQPKNPSAGSCFKNPPNNFAGKLIEEAGMKGYQIGGMAFSEVHANFLVNLGDGTVEDALEIIELAQKKVLENSGVKLELEVKII